MGSSIAGQLDHSNHDLLVGHSDADALRQPGLGGEVLEVLAEDARVGDLAVADEAVGQVEACGADDSAAIDLCSGEVTAVYVETDRAAF